MFSRPPYCSDITLLIEDLKKQDKQLENRQLQARATWWEPKIVPEFMRRVLLAQVKQSPYVYQVAPQKNN